MTIDKRRNLSTVLSYLAGFLGGEGCISINRKPKYINEYYITVSSSNSSIQPLQLLEKYFGGCISFQQKSKNFTIWQYKATHTVAADICRTLVGYSIIKKQQYELAIYFHDHLQYITLEEKKELYIEMKELKRR